jgi:hypothetical protein
MRISQENKAAFFWPEAWRILSKAQRPVNFEMGSDGHATRQPTTFLLA